MDFYFGSYVWNVEKEQENKRKHGVNFRNATEAFLDPERKIYKDGRHSDHGEERFFCLGRVRDQILTVRFTYRADKIRIIGAGYWKKGEKYYYEK